MVSTALFCSILLKSSGQFDQTEHKLPALFTQVEAKLYDLRFSLRGKLMPPESVVIADIDEKSLARSVCTG